MDHLNTRLLSYIAVAEENSQILANQSSAMISVSTQINSLSQQVEDNILHLEAGFEKLRESMHLTKLSALSLSGDSRIWMIAGVGGFLLGTVAGFIRWIIFIGMNSHIYLQ
jgi:hypothetical protein